MVDQPAKPPSMMRWFTGGAAVLFFLCLGAGGVAYWYVEGVLRQFEPLANRQIRAMVKGDWNEAYACMSPGFQKRTTLEDFKKAWKDHPHLLSEPEFHAESFSRKGDEGWVLAGRLTFHKPGEAAATYRLELGGAPAADRIAGFEWSK